MTVSFFPNLNLGRKPAGEQLTGVPVLSPGRHRSAANGACFMEFASFLAGERWSDHPACTHPLLAALAREVNDCTTDEGRGALVPLIPSVVGLTSEDPRLVPALVVRCVGTAMESASAADQFVLVVALVRAEQVLAELEQAAGGDSRPPEVAVPSEVRRRAAAFLGSRPHPRRTAYENRAAPRSIAAAVRAIVRSGSSRTDALLRRLLTEAIDECLRWQDKLEPDRRTRVAGAAADAACGDSSGRVPGAVTAR
ncbi:hypothetical protein [Kribbella sp. CA-293567]|uniref:hypothetical protein n=1 Tax=Kribbella sp. CA-293567 TaxID=3002436 RepID=UPI0022DDC966|nr:hypothetical protein [Kribbella sp. CA-293567]WBQ08363.1 hypothetical protein OX958_16480 [Kribbella sp. CA-293567]